MGKACVFISHSTKDTEAPPAAGAGAQAWARWQRLRVARALREAIVKALEEREGIDPWLDKRELQPGMLWRDGIHERLARCDGAVLLLTPEALQSGWVLKEATILTWLHALGAKMLLVPVLVGIRSADLETHGFGPLTLREIEAERVFDDLDPDDRPGLEEVASRIAARFENLAAGARMTPAGLLGGGRHFPLGRQGEWASPQAGHGGARVARVRPR